MWWVHSFYCRRQLFVYIVVFQSQYKFIYLAISDYVDLYRNKDDEYAYSVPVNAVNSAAAATLK